MPTDSEQWYKETHNLFFMYYPLCTLFGWSVFCTKLLSFECKSSNRETLHLTKITSSNTLKTKIITHITLYIKMPIKIGIWAWNRYYLPKFHFHNASPYMKVLRLRIKFKNYISLNLTKELNYVWNHNDRISSVFKH